MPSIVEATITITMSLAITYKKQNNKKCKANIPNDFSLLPSIVEIFLSSPISLIFTRIF